MIVLNVPKNYNPEFYMFTKNGTLERFNCPKTFAMLFIFNIINIYLTRLTSCIFMQDLASSYIHKLEGKMC